VNHPPKRRPSFPILIKAGSVIVKVYGTKNRSDVVYTVAWRDEQGVRKRRNFSDLDKAKVEAEKIAAALQRGEFQILKLSGEQRIAYERSIQLLTPYGLRFDSFAAEYAEARRILGPAASLTEAARVYAKAQSWSLPPKSVTDAVAEMIASKTADMRSRRHVQDLESRLRRFAADFKGRISDVTSADLSAWLSSLGQSPRSRNNFRAAIVSLFNFAKQRGYLAKREPTEADDLTKVTDRGSDIGILTPDQMATLLNADDAQLRAYFAIGGFGGLRTSELMQLEWSEIDLEENTTITVQAHKSKTASRRTVPIQPNLYEWLMPLRRFSGRVFSLSTINQKATAFAHATGVTPWPSNALRHSFASYRFAVCRNAEQVASEMGNSRNVVFASYRELVQPRQAERWWNISPAANSKIARISAA
jgi:integrase